MTISPECSVEKIKKTIDGNHQDFEMHMTEVYSRITQDLLYISCSPKIPYAKSRIKSWDSVEKKIIESGEIIDEKNVMHKISDFVGVRILMLNRSQMKVIDSIIRKNISSGRWSLREKPKAYEYDLSWERELNSMEFEVKRKDSYYTSLHYLISPASDERICCEVQVRTLIEETWGEVEHYFKYKNKSGEALTPKKENEIRILAHLAMTGRSLVEHIFRDDRETGAEE